MDEDQTQPASSNDPAQPAQDPFASLGDAANTTMQDPWHTLALSATQMKQSAAENFQAQMTSQVQQHVQELEAQRGAPLSVSEKFGIESAVRENALGKSGNIIQSDQDLNRQVGDESAKTNTFLQNFGSSALNTAAQGGVDVIRAVGTANAAQHAQQNIQSQYGQAEQGSAGDLAGQVAGGVAGAVPMIAAPEVAPFLMAAQGLGHAESEVDASKASGNGISNGDALGYEIASAGLQGMLGYATGGVSKAASGLLTKAAGKLAPSMIEAITASEGRVLVPYIANVMSRAGVGASEGEILNTAQNIAARISGLDSNRSLAQGALSAGLQGAALAGGHAAVEGVHALPTGQEVSGGEETAHPAAPLPGENTESREPVAVETAQAQAQGEAPAAKAAPEPSENSEASESLPVSRFASEENPYANAEDEGERDVPPEARGRSLPVDDKLVDEDLTAKLKAQAAEEPKGLPAGNGSQPNDAFDHPLIQKLHEADPSAQEAEIPPHLKDDVSDFEKATGKKIIGFTSNKTMGFQHPDVTDAVGINLNNPQESLHNVMAHEWGHAFQDENPEAAQKIYDAVPPEQRRQIMSEYLSRYKNQYGEEKALQYLKQNGRDEVVSSIIGEGNATNQRIRDAIAQKEPTLWGKIKESVQTFLGKFTAKGRLVNAVVEGIRNRIGTSDAGGGAEVGPDSSTKVVPASKEKTGVDAGQNAETPEAKLKPRLKQYTEMGHQAEGQAKVDLWWKDENGDIQTREATGKNSTHIGAGDEAAEAEVRGRIDHTNKQVSVAGDISDAMADRRTVATAKRLQSMHPDYEVYVAGRGGMVPLHEYENGGRFMLPKLENIVHEEDDVKKFKSMLNQFTPANGTKFEITPEDKVKQQVFDKEAPLVKMVRTAMSRLNDPAKLSPEAYIRSHAGFGQTRAQQVEKGLRSIHGQEILDPKTNEKLTRDWLLKPVSDSVRAGHGEANEMLSYTRSIMVAERTLEKAQQSKGKDAITGIGKNRPGGSSKANDVAEANDFLAKAKSDPAWDNAQESIRRMRLWGNEHIRMAEESGLISKIQARDIIDQNKYYANTSRVFEDAALINPNDPGYANGSLHKFRGDDRLINDPISNMMQSTEQLAKNAQENFTKQKILEIAKQFPDLAQESLTPAAPGKVQLPLQKVDTIAVKQSGQDHFYTVHPDVANAVNAWGTDASSAAMWKWLSAPGKLKLMGTLIRPMFQWNHFRKQFQNRIMLGEGSGGLKGIADSLKGFDPEAKELLDVLGGTMTHNRDYGTSSNDYFKMMSKTLGKLSSDPNTLLALPRKAWEGYGKLSEWADGFNRIVEYKGALDQAKQRGMNPLDAQTYAAWKARDLMDFSVSGKMVQELNSRMYVPFLNAEVQGLRKMYEAFRIDPVKASARAAAFGLIPAMAPYLWAKSQGKDVEDDYKQTPLAQRIMYYQYHIGNYKMMIPKGQTQAMVSAMWEAYLDKHNGDVQTWAKAMGESGMIPRPLVDPESVIPFQGARDAVSNYSWFYGKNIVPPDENNIALDLRHTDGASRLGQYISKAAKAAGMELDPRKIDHVMQNDLGTVGIDAQSASNVERTDHPLGSQLPMSDMRLPSGYTSQSVQDAMTKAQYYNDSSSPQYAAMKTPLEESYKAATPGARNDLVDKARAAGDAVTSFYDQHGDDLLKAKEAAQKINQAEEALKSQGGISAQRQWYLANPEEGKLAVSADSLRRMENRVSEWRKILARPNVSAEDTTAANKNLTSLYAAIQGLVK